MESIKSVLDFCRGCTNHFFNASSNSEFWYCPKLKAVAVRSVDHRFARWIIRTGFDETELSRAIEAGRLKLMEKNLKGNLKS